MSQQTFKCIEGHTEGMPVRMVIEGVPVLHGKDMGERRLELIRHHDPIRRALSFEPKGHGQMSGTFFCPPLSDNADFGLLFYETSDFLPMCGHATIGSITFALENDLVQPRQPGQVVVDVPAGQVTAQYSRQGHKVTSVRFTNVPSFLLHRDVEIHLPALGRLKLDIAYGGNFYPIIEVQDNYPGAEHFSPDQLLVMGREVQKLVNQALDVVHPDHSHIRGVRHCMWTGQAGAADAHGRGVVIAGGSIIDRSPCGTGTSARVAQRFARGLLGQGEAYVHESLIGSRFIGRVEATTTLGSGLAAVYPSVEGRAFITGRSEHYIDEADPYAYGFDIQEFSR